ncbi:MAG: endonuclease/exonuclease/phosphatase family protein [Marinosulfonomonas sp.]
MRRLVEIIFFATIGLIVLSFAGAWHGIGDSLAVFRFWLALLLVATAVLLLIGRRGAFAAIIAVCVAATVPLASVHLTPAPAGPLKYALYQKNLLYSNKEMTALNADILSSNPDFVTLEEVFHKLKPAYRALAEHFPSSVICDFTGTGQVAVLSRWPMVEGSETCIPGSGVAALQVRTPDGPVWAVAIHLHWPYPMEQREQVEQILPILETLQGPKVVAGDFNMVPWSHSMRAISRAAQAKRLGPTLRTLIHPTQLLRLPIDHVLVTGGQGRVQTRPLLGSDHLGVYAQFNF